MPDAPTCVECDRPHHARGRCHAHYQAWLRRNPDAARNTRLPAAPIVERVEARGGIAKVLGPRRLHPHLHRAYYAIRARGTVTASMADELCIRVLRLHPALVYGLDWTEAA